MKFELLLFCKNGDYYSTDSFTHKNSETIIVKNINLHEKHKNDVGYTGYFTIREKGGTVSGLRRFLKCSPRTKDYLKLFYVDNIPDEIRETFGDYIYVVSDNVGLRNVVNSFNDLLERKNVIGEYDSWLDTITNKINIQKRDIVSQYVTKFVNLYIIKIYEKIYGKNLNLLKSHESEIVYKIIETSLMQKIL